jgi:PIN domain nuclease of toxin-antitoxin system
MKLLLDTHILVWAALDPRRIGLRLRRALERPSNELWLSPVSTWEVAMLVDRRHVRIDTPFEEWFAAVTTALSLNEALLTDEVVFASREIRLDHQDAADLLIAATARHYGLRLVTADERLLKGSGFSTMANR